MTLRPAPVTRTPGRRGWHRELAAVAVAMVVAVSGCSAATKHAAPPRTTLPPTTSAPTTTTTAPPIRYQVKRGDSLSSIAKQFGVTVAVIITMNHLTNANQLSTGQTLTIPPAPPVKLVITPANGQPGDAFAISLTGVRPTETVTFQINAPGGGQFTGPPHSPAPDGSISASYQTSPVDATGVYTVIAKGTEGTAAQATFRVDTTTTTG